MCCANFVHSTIILYDIVVVVKVYPSTLGEQSLITLCWMLHDKRRLTLLFRFDVIATGCVTGAGLILLGLVNY